MTAPYPPSLECALSKALKESCLRLSWYVAEFGDIPEKEQLKLLMLANGLTSDSEGLLAMAQEFQQYFTGMFE